MVFAWSPYIPRLLVLNGFGIGNAIFVAAQYIAVRYLVVLDKIFMVWTICNVQDHGILPLGEFGQVINRRYFDHRGNWAEALLINIHEKVAML